MKRTCPTCGCTCQQEMSVPEQIAELRAECARQGISITWDGFVNAAGAAHLLGLKTETLRNRRSLGLPPAYRKKGGHSEYRLDHLAKEIDR